MDEKIINTLRHIFDSHIDNAPTIDIYSTWYEARDIVEYALAGNYEMLKKFDRWPTVEDKEE